jgi:hypothetical protein
VVRGHAPSFVAHQQAGTPVILLRGTGRVRDELATAAHWSRIHALDVNDQELLRSVLFATPNPPYAAFHL